MGFHQRYFADANKSIVKKKGKKHSCTSTGALGIYVGEPSTEYSGLDAEKEIGWSVGPYCNM